MVRGVWVPVSVHRAMSLSDTRWGCDSVFVGVEKGHVHPMCQPRFGFPQPSAGRAVLQGQCLWRSCGCGSAFPQQGHQALPASAHRLSQVGHPIFAQLLGTISLVLVHPLPSWIPMGRVSFIWELCSGLAGYPCVTLLLPWGQEGGPRKAQAHWAHSKWDLPQSSLFPVIGILGVPLVWVPSLGLGASSWALGMAGSTLAGPRYPQPSQPISGWCLSHKQLSGSWLITLHQVSTVYLPSSTAALTGAPFCARVMVPVCTREENALPLGNELQSEGEA